MALPALLGAGARAVGGSMVKAGGRAVAGKVLGRGKKTQPGRLIPSGGEQGGGGRGGAIVPRTKMVSAKEIKSLQTGDTVSPGKDPLKSIYSNVILIEKILKGNNIADRDALKEQKKNDKKADKDAQEKKLETKPPKIDKKKGEIKKLPETGIFGWIKNFIGNILMGYFAVRLIKYLPQIMGLLKGLGHVVDFVTDVGMFLVDGVATFIDFAYNVYDGTRNIMKGIGLEGAFDAIMKAAEIAITVLTFALGAKSLGGFGGGGGRGGGGRTGISGRGAGRTPTTSPQAARRYAQRFGRDAATRRFGEQGVRSLGGKYARSGFTNFARKATVGVLGKGGTKAALKIVKPLVKNVPIIGGVMEFALSLLAGESVGKAAFRGVGSGLGMWIGGALGSLIPIPFVGTAIGTFIGGAGGAELAGAMYDAFFGGKQKQPNPPEEPEAKQSGGKVGSGFQEGTLRQQKKALRKRPSFEKIKAPEGGKIKSGKKTEKAWWDFLGWAGTGGQDEMMDLGPGGQMLANRVVNVGNSFGEHPFFGPILSLAAKVILGETPNEREYKNVGYGLNMLIGEGVAKGKIGEGIKGYADGGMINDYRTITDINVGRWATDAFRKELSNTLYKTFDMKKSDDEDKKSSDPSSPPGSGRRASRSRSGSSTGGIQGNGINKGIAIAKKLMVDMNISAAAAAGIVGNLMLESALIPDNVENGKGFEDGAIDNIPAGTRRVGYGYGQWTNDRLEKFRKFLTDRGANSEPATDDLNYAYLLHEFNTSEPLFNHWKTNTSIPEDDPAQAATWFMMNWERPGVPHQDKRQEYARSIYDKIKGVTKESAKAEIEAAGGSFIPAGPATGEEGEVDFMNPDNLAGLDAGKPKKVYMHWTAGGYNSIVGPYHTIFTGDGTMHRRVPYDQHSDHTYRRNTNSVGLSVAAMAGAAGNYQWPKQAQLEGLTNEIARLANEWGWSSSDINIKNVMTHGEAGSNKDGRVMHDNYGPTVWGGTAERWDLDQLNPSQQIGEGGEILRGMIAKKLSSGEFMGNQKEEEARRSHAGTKLSNREEMLKILPGQSLLDENTSKALGATNLARFNAASTPEEIQKISGQIAGVSDYAPYEQGAQQTVVVQDPPQQMSEESPQSSGGGMMGMSGGSSHDPFEFLDFQG